MLKDQKREEGVTEFAKEWALKFDLEQEPIVTVISGIMNATIRVEVAYIQKLDARTNLSGA